MDTTPLKDLAEKFGTPLLVMDLEVVKENYMTLKKNIKNVEIYYAVKANSHENILKLLRDLGSNFDVASRGEIDKLLSLGVSPDRMSFGNTIKKLEDIEYAYKKGVRMFAVDAEMELEKIAKVAKGSKIYVRLSTNGMEEDADWPLTRKFGTSVEHCIKLVKYAKDLGLEPIGVSFHVGSQNYNPENWRIAIKQTAEIFNAAKAMGIKLNMVNTGGGVPVRYIKEIPKVEEIAKVINESVEQYLGKDVRVIAEPGRSMVGNAGIMITKVILRSTKFNENWVYVDAGVFHGLTETIQNIKYRISVEGKDNESKEKFNLAGPTCDSMDVMYYNIELPKSITMNDLVYFFAAGAYTLEYGTTFNGIPSPKCVFADGIVKKVDNLVEIKVKN